MCVCHQRQSNNMLYKIYDVKNERVAACNRLHTRKDRQRRTSISGNKDEV